MTECYSCFKWIPAFKTVFQVDLKRSFPEFMVPGETAVCYPPPGHWVAAASRCARSFKTAEESVEHAAKMNTTAGVGR